MHTTDHIDIHWHCFPWRMESAALQLAAVDVLWARMAVLAQPTLRWYRANESALILGTGQKLTEINTGACQSTGVACYRRISGGTAVFFEPDFVMQDIALPTHHPLYLNDVTESYRWLGETWVATLRAYGLDARMITIAEARADTQTLDPLTRRVCFGGLSPYEIVVEGRKLVGFSQIRRRAGAMFQVGIYLRWEPQRLVTLLTYNPAEAALLRERLAARVVSLADLLPEVPTLISLTETFAVALQSVHGVRLIETAWGLEEQETQIRALARYQPL